MSIAASYQKLHLSRARAPLVGTSQAPARSDDGRAVVLFPRTGAITAVGPAGRVDARELSCAPRQLRYPRLVLACPAPLVMNVRTGSVQTPPDLPAPGGAWASFFRAGRYWLEGGGPRPVGGRWLSCATATRATSSSTRAVPISTRPGRTSSR